jgi:hypothetical protein
MPFPSDDLYPRTKVADNTFKLMILEISESPSKHRR